MHTSLPFMLSVDIAARIVPTDGATNTPKIYPIGTWDIKSHGSELSPISTKTPVEHTTCLEGAITYLMDALDTAHPLHDIPQSSIEYTLRPQRLHLTFLPRRGIIIPMVESTPWSRHPNAADMFVSTYDYMAIHPYISTQMRGIMITPSCLHEYTHDTLFQHIPFPYSLNEHQHRHINISYNRFNTYTHIHTCRHMITLPVDIGQGLMIAMNEASNTPGQYTPRILCIHTEDYVKIHTAHNEENWGSRPVLGECPWPCTPHDIATMLVDIHQYLPPSSHHARIDWVRQWQHDPSTHPTIQAIMAEAYTYCEAIQAWTSLPVTMLNHPDRTHIP